MKNFRLVILVIFSQIVSPCFASELPSGFVYLKDIDSSIKQDIRYATNHNFVGRPVTGYQAEKCILTLPAAKALQQVQKELLLSNLSLKVFDCYRPQMAVNDFIQWSQQSNDQKMKAEFYPRVNKKDVFSLGYVAAKSGHSRGSTMDLTIVPLSAPSVQPYQEGQKLVSCIAPFRERFRDQGLDMGTGFDCFDDLAHNDRQDINIVAYHNRLILKTLMEKYGFVPYEAEWWHFTLKNEPYPDTYCNFPVK